MITKKEVIVNIGYKSEGVVAANEFRYNPDLKVGDTVDVYVEVQEDKTGQLIVSHRTARMHSAWIRVNDVLRSGEIITGYVEPSLQSAKNLDQFQFQRLGYFCVDKESSTEKLIFNKTVGLRDTWAKVESKE
jgi:small subunit ribosomal protein S1